ncbi:MAG: DUF3857 domain-containing transglutaminase family protein [Burkholderiales bacterium]|nr:DUF3857 domain-containing transglutaminase family protein [Burkholderiales bacterium]
MGTRGSAAGRGWGRVLLAGWLLLSAALGSQAQPQAYQVGKPPPWVLVQVPDSAAVAPHGEPVLGVHWLLFDQQLRVEEGGPVRYWHSAFRLLNEQGVKRQRSLKIGLWAHEQLTLHAITVRRGGQVVDQLAVAKVSVQPWRKDLEAQRYGAGHWIHFELDVRVGDIVEHAYSVRSRSPASGGRFFGQWDLQLPMAAAQVHARLLWPTGRTLQLRQRSGAPAPRVTTGTSHSEYRWDLRDVPASPVEDDTPGWYRPSAFVQASEFADWADVARWALPLFRVPDTLGPKGDAEVRRIAAQHADAEGRLLAVLQFAQREVRRLSLDLDAEQLVPQAPAQVLEWGFGNASDKALLTVSMLRGLGIEAQPALVHTRVRSHIEQDLPSPGAFNHVVVRARVAGHEVWLDPSRPPQHGALSTLVQADHGQALLVADGSVALTPMNGSLNSTKWREVHAVIDARGGPGMPVRHTVNYEFEGAAAETLREHSAHSGRDQAFKAHSLAAGAKPGYLESFWSDDRMANRLTITEEYNDLGFWKRSNGQAGFEASLQFPSLNALLPRPRPPERSAPLALQHPTDLVQVTELRLPPGMAGKPREWRVDDLAFEYQRTEAWRGDTLVLTQRIRTRRDHVPVANLAQYAANLEKAGIGGKYQVFLDAAKAPAAAGSTSPHWLPTVVFTLGVVGCTVLAVRLHGWDPAPLAPLVPAGRAAPVGLGGWGALAGLLIGLAWLAAAWQLLAGMPPLTDAGWRAATTPGADGYHLLAGPAALFNMLAQVLRLAMLSVLASLFLRRRSSLPQAGAALCASGAVLTLVDTLLAAQVPARHYTATDWGLFAASLALALAGPAYLLRAQRVRSTFVVRLRAAAAPHGAAAQGLA